MHHHIQKYSFAVAAVLVATGLSVALPAEAQALTQARRAPAATATVLAGAPARYSVVRDVNFAV